MKSKRSLINKNIIAIAVLVIAVVISGKISYDKQGKYNELEFEKVAYLETIKTLKNDLKKCEEKLDEIDNLDFIETYAREILKMARPNEIHMRVNYNNEDETD